MLAPSTRSVHQRAQGIVPTIAVTAFVACAALVLLAVPQARAQEDAAVSAIDSAIADVAAVAGTTEAPAEVAADLEVRPEDLDVRDPRILPDSRLYGIKKLWRGARLLVTRDPVKEAELRMRYANEKLIEAKTLAKEKGDTASVAISSAMDAARKDMEAIANEAEALRNASERKAEDVDRFLEKFADRTMKHRRIFDDIETRMPDAVREHVVDVRQQMMEHVGDVVGHVEDADAMAQRFERAMEGQRGSEFTNFKNLEILKELEAKVPEEARAAIAHAREQTRKRMTEQLGQSEEHRGRFEEYVRHLPGDAVRQFEILDDMRSDEGLDPAFLKKIDDMKARAAEKFGAEFEQRSGEARDRMLEAFRDADVGSLRTAEQLKHFVPPEAREEIEKVEATQFDRFRAAFSSDPKAIETANIAQDLMRKMRENPDAVDFAVLQRIEEQLTPEQKVFVRKMEQEGAERFRERFEAERDGYLDRFTDPNAPRSLEVLEELRGRLPPEAFQGIDRAIEVHKRNFEEHMGRLEDPRTLGHLKDAIELDPELKAAFEAGDPEFFRKVGAKQEELMQRGVEKRMEIEAKVRPLFEDPDAPIPDDLPVELRRKVEEQRRFIRETEERHRRAEGERMRAGAEGALEGPAMPPTQTDLAPELRRMEERQRVPPQFDVPQQPGLSFPVPIVPQVVPLPVAPQVVPLDAPAAAPGAVRAPGVRPNAERQQEDSAFEEKFREHERRVETRTREEERRVSEERIRAELERQRDARTAPPTLRGSPVQREPAQPERVEQRGGFPAFPFPVPAIPSPIQPFERRGDRLNPSAPIERPVAPPVEQPLGALGAPIRSVVALFP